MWMHHHRSRLLARTPAQCRRLRPCRCSTRAESVQQVAKQEARFTAQVIKSINEIPAADWDALAHGSSEELNPFLTHAFLSALEQSGSACRDEGWQPLHLLLRWSPESQDEAPHQQAHDGILVGAVPMYLKSHSYGEYVFDSSWANLSTMLGEPWYPKLQSCVPFTPVTGPRLLSKAPEGMHRLDVVRALGTALIKLTESMQVSGVHLTFNTEEEAAALEELGFMTRLGIQFHWDNDASEMQSDKGEGSNGRGTGSEKGGDKSEGSSGSGSESSDGEQGVVSCVVPQTHGPQQQSVLADNSSTAGQVQAAAAAVQQAAEAGGGTQVSSFTAQPTSTTHSHRNGSTTPVTPSTEAGLRSHAVRGVREGGYGSFEAFLAALKQSKRKSIRQERKSITKQGLRVRQLTGDALRGEGRHIWDMFYEFYCYTVGRKWGTAYLKKPFFYTLGDTMADQVLLVVAEEQLPEGGWKLVAGSLNLLGSHTIYGRNWALAPDIEFKNLHFELCYYQAVEYAITHGYTRVEAGAQGEHKLQRGYLPSLTYSSHWVRHPAMKHAVQRFLVREQAQVMLGLQNLTLEGSPYKQAHTLTALMSKVEALKGSAVSSVSSVMDSLSSGDEVDGPQAGGRSATG